MIPYNHHADLVLGEPHDWDTEKNGPCEGLPVRVLVDQNTFLSYWRPSWRERLAIFFGRHVRLSVYSVAHPPVWIDTEKN